MRAGKLRYTVTIEQRSDTPNANGDTVTAWATFAANVPASINDLSGRELIAAAATQSEISTRITIRYLAGVNAAMRVRGSDGRLYNIAAVVGDNKSGAEWLTLVCSQGLNDG
jgi:SPP1 family predicted phage head-tail adaptor